MNTAIRILLFIPHSVVMGLIGLYLGLTSPARELKNEIKRRKRNANETKENKRKLNERERKTPQKREAVRGGANGQTQTL